MFHHLELIFITHTPY